MTEDITAVLRRAVDGVIREYDPGDVERRGMRLRRTRQRTTALSVAAVVLALSVSSVSAVQAWRSQRPTAPSGIDTRMLPVRVSVPGHYDESSFPLPVPRTAT